MGDMKRYALAVATVLALAGLPVAVVHTSGSASAGLSAGFLEVMDNVLHLLLVLPVGLMASWLRADGRVILPLCFLLMYLIGGMMEMDFVLYPMVKLFILGAILVFGLALSVADSRVFLGSAFVSASVAYHLGGWGMKALPTLASPLYFLIGQFLALVLALAISFSIGMLLFSEAAGYRRPSASLPPSA